jgi:hypothetical protein
MPAIRLRSTRFDLRSACYPPAIILPIRLRSACDPVRSPCVQSPHTPVRSHARIPSPCSDRLRWRSARSNHSRKA